MRITKKLKSVPETFRSIRIKEYDEKKKKFPVFNKIKNGNRVSFKNKEIEAQERHRGIKEYTPSMLLKTKQT